MHLRRMRLIVALMAGAVVLLVASPAQAIKPEFERVKPHVSAHIDLGVLADGTLVAERGDGTLVLPPDVAPPSQRAWRLSDDPAPVVEGQIVRGQLFIDWLMAYFTPAAAGTRGVPGVVAVMVVPESEPCDSGRGSPATAEITYDGETLTAAVRISCIKPGHLTISNPSWTAPSV
jgi:hypothetical protein